MTAQPRVRPFPARGIDELADAPYDGVLASLGFERRSRDIPAAVDPTPSAVAVPFGDRHEDTFAENKEWFDDHEWEQPQFEEAEYFAWVDAWLQARAEEASGVARVAVDVSSTSRYRMAAVIEALLSLPPETRLEVDFLYAPARFEEPSSEDEPPVFSVAPVSGYFAGWWRALEAPLYAIIGVGYELERASCAINMLEPERAEVYVPDGNDPRYLEEVRKANRGLMETRGVEHEVLYDVGDPFSCFRQLEASISRLERDQRVAIVPLGPKIFAVCAILAGGLHLDSTQVIRITAGERQRPIPRESDGNVYGLTLSFSPTTLQEGDGLPEERANARADADAEESAHTNRQVGEQQA